MNKNDLRYCDVVETRNGHTYILLKGNFEDNDTVFMNINTGSFLRFNHNNDLTSEDSHFDIMKVKHFKYSGNAFRDLGMIRGYSEEKITWDWERKFEYYNCKVVCINSNNSSYFTKGKVYKVEKGIVDNDGHTESHYFGSQIKNIDDLNSRSSIKFIELAED